MKITSVGYDFKHNSDFGIVRSNGLNDYLFLIIRSPALFCINGKEIRISSNSMIFISKNTPHAFYADGEQFVNDWVAVDFSEHEKSFVCDSIGLNTFFDSPDVHLCSKLIEYMQNENTLKNPTKDSTMNSLFNVILNKLRNNSAQCYSNKKYYRELKNIRETIYSNPCAKYSINELSATAHLSNSYFQRLYKLYFGVSPISDVINSRTEYAKQLLVSTNHSIADIAEILGYPTDMQFIKQFKVLTKTTPNKYRNSINNR